MRKIKYGISDLDRNHKDYKFRLDTYKKLGYDFVSFNWYKDPSNAPVSQYEIIEYAKKINLDIDDIHLEFIGCNELWAPLKNNSYVNYVTKSLNEISKYNCKNVIFHISSTFNPPPYCKEGIENLKYILNVAKQNNITIMMENLKRIDYFDYLMENVKADNLKICFDSGHANCFMTEYDSFLNKYYPLIETTHLHDNYAGFDEHNAIFDGNIDWQNLMKKLSKSPVEKLHIEAYKKEKILNDEEFTDFVRLNLENAKKLAKLL